ncbi:uncharacterized protein LOC129409749 isoform X1 [Boleophthalmus pectinirostris]|uniref:uncharacterized protein LOC129409749 isoform X1 n=1 Tax=Boleophthalmus pectinirostris TaxID=150288 RepID=UPI00242C3E8B|nr:uncharacterized protein LOC129409749 isoform X1 [Boleophthalmus pectinirostris]
MNKFITAALLLTSFSWSSWSVVVTVKPGEDVVLTCRKVKEKVFWASLVNNGKYKCIATNNNDTSMCPGMENNARFEISVDNSHVSLKIKSVKMADSGFFFCVVKPFGNGDVDVVQLNVEGTSALWVGVIVGGLCVVLVLVIVQFAREVKKFLTAQSQEPTGSREDEATQDLNYAAVNFQPKTRHSRRALQNDPHVIYADTR